MIFRVDDHPHTTRVSHTFSLFITHTFCLSISQTHTYTHTHTHTFHTLIFRGTFFDDERDFRSKTNRVSWNNEKTEALSIVSLTILPSTFNDFISPLIIFIRHVSNKKKLQNFKRYFFVF